MKGTNSGAERMFCFESSQSSSLYTIFCVLCRRWKHFPGKVISPVRLDHLCVCHGMALTGRDVELALWRLGGLEMWEIILSNIPGSPGPSQKVSSLSVPSWVEEVLQPPPYLSALTLGSDFLSTALTNPEVCLQERGQQAA